MKSKGTAAVLALLLGGLGVHKFYLGRSFQGLLYLFFCWTFIPAVIAFVEFIILLMMSEAEFDAKYNGGVTVPALQPQNIVVNVANTASTGLSRNDFAENLRSLRELKDSGTLTDDEFLEMKQKLLNATN